MKARDLHPRTRRNLFTCDKRGRKPFSCHGFRMHPRLSPDNLTGPRGSKHYKQSPGYLRLHHTSAHTRLYYVNGRRVASVCHFVLDFKVAEVFCVSVSAKLHPLSPNQVIYKYIYEYLKICVFSLLQPAAKAFQKSEVNIWKKK